MTPEEMEKYLEEHQKEKEKMLKGPHDPNTYNLPNEIDKDGFVKIPTVPVKRMPKVRKM